MTKLLPCPFCGQPARSVLGGTVINCSNDLCDVLAEVQMNTAEQAAEAWNTRAPSTERVTVAADLEKCLDDLALTQIYIGPLYNAGHAAGLSAAKKAIRAALSHPAQGEK